MPGERGEGKKPEDQAFDLDSIVPSEIAEPFQKWHLGKTAFDVPVSLTLEKIRCQFSLSGLDGKKRVEFYEIPIDQMNDGRTALYTNKPLRRYGYLPFDESFRTEIDISHTIDQPAVLTSYFHVSKSAG